jgi:uncharacterized protein
MESISFMVGDSEIRGMIHKNFDGPQPGIILCHGYFQSNKIGPSSLYVQIAENLSNNGITCLRIDCRGMGESDGSFSDVTYHSFIQDINEGIKFLIDNYEIRKSKIGIIGHSMGGNIALDVASLNKDINFACLLSPFYIKKIEGDYLLSEEQLIELKNIGETTRKGVKIWKRFLDPILNNNIYDIALKFDKNSLIIQGLNDKSYNHDDFQNLKKIFKKSPSFHFIEKANHNYYPIEIRFQLYQQIREWFKINGF